MIVLIPLGGLGTRFKNYGYSYPKPLVKVLGKPIIYWLLDNLNLRNIDFVAIPYNKELAIYRFEDLLKKDYKINFKFYSLDHNTEGSAETILEMLNYLEKEGIDDKPILCLDGDNFYKQNIIDQWNGDNCVFTFFDKSTKPIYSYLDISKKNNNEILDIVEKIKISDYASTGGYGFESWKNLKSYCQFIIDKDIKQHNEYYTSNVIKEMIKDGHKFVAKYIEDGKFICLGTPFQVRLFCNKNKDFQNINKMRICFDLDNTLVTFPEIDDDYSSVKPIENNINFLKFLKTLGHTIIIYTARRMKTHEGNSGKVLADIAQLTFETLEKFEIPYDEIYFGKPYAHFYIDDLAVSCFSNLEKELGFYNSMIDTRYFNSISQSNVDTFIKSSDNLDGEIYYYDNIPKQIKNLFPTLIRSDLNHKWYEIEKIEGIPISKLYLAEELTTEHLDIIFNSIIKIHSCEISNIDQEINIYLNYTNKLKKRYNPTNFSKFKDSELVYDYLLENLKKYEENNMGIKSIIHGDPVFTNIIIDISKSVKFIDMKGYLGDKKTIIGDIFYDWAKIYQSLIGYDEILDEKYLNKNYKDEMINHFKKIFIEKYSEQDLEKIKLLTKSLLFTLIPLHDVQNNKKCYKYYNLIFSKYLK